MRKNPRQIIAFIVITLMICGTLISINFYIQQSANILSRSELRSVTPSISASISTNAQPSIRVGHSVDLGSDDKSLLSPDETMTAIFSGEELEGAGSPLFTQIVVIDRKTNNSVTYQISGPLLYASADAPLFWSPVDNRLYFTHATNGIINYSLWSSNIDGSDPKLISGKPDSEDDQVGAYDDSAIYGAIKVNYSVDGKYVITQRQWYKSENKLEYWVMHYDGSNSHKISESEYNALISQAL